MTTREEAIEDEKNVKLVQFLVENNKPYFNIFKAIEETTEFNEALVKHITKHIDNVKKPSIKDIIDEYGDVIYRGMIAIATVQRLNGDSYAISDIEEKVLERVNYKLNKLKGWLKENKYEQGL